jgi:hypothetical protein
MSKNPFRSCRSDVRGLAVLCVIVTFAPSLLAQTAETATPEAQGSAFKLLLPGNFSGSFETAGFQSATAAQTKDDAPAAPPDNSAQPSLRDLGFTPEQAKGSAEAQARLDKRSHMLKIHQRLGLITLVPLLATIITSGSASGKHGSASGRDLHGALGVVTAGMYIATASYAIRAPKVPGIEVRGPIRLHKALAWIHGVGMILSPILGAMARAQLDRGERVHGIAAAHSAVADVTVAAYAAAIASVAIKY